MKTLWLAVAIVLVACAGSSPPPAETGTKKGKCDDGSLPTCPMTEPKCADGTITAVKGGCFSCVDPKTCEAPAQ